MKINDLGFFIGSKTHLENMKIITVFSLNNGIISGITRQRNNANLVVILDKIKFEWSSKSKDNLGYLNFGPDIHRASVFLEPEVTLLTLWFVNDGKIIALPGSLNSLQAITKVLNSCNSPPS